MKSQWECVRQNLGDWQGSFTHISPQGDILEDIPSHISLTSSADKSTIHLVLTRSYPAAPGSPELVPQVMAIDLSAPGAGALFFETGAFSEGGIYFTNHAKFGAEFCLITPSKDRRLRLVQMFDDTGKFDRLTLIREQRVESNAPERPPLLLSDLIGTWQGVATILKPQETVPATVIQETIQTDQLEFEQDGLSYRTLLLPDGAFATCPIQITAGRAFSLEMGWLLAPHLRQRLIRQYDATGSWITLMLLIETRNP
jgi:Domain of unknown function (DUF3598)